MTADAQNDRWLDLVGRFEARGAQLRIGSAEQDMLKHLLDSVEEIEVTLRAVEDRLRRKDST